MINEKIKLAVKYKHLKGWLTTFGWLGFNGYFSTSRQYSAVTQVVVKFNAPIKLLAKNLTKYKLYGISTILPLKHAATNTQCCSDC